MPCTKRKNAGFVLPEHVDQAAILIPICDILSVSVTELQASLAALCPGFPDDVDATVNIDEETRPMINMLGHEHGRIMIDLASDL